MKILTFSALLLMNLAAFAQSDSFIDSFRDGKLILGLRFRVEHVDLDRLEETATAMTLRTNLGYETAAWRGIQLLAEVENVLAVDDEKYNSTENGVTDRPVVPDPEDTELNRLQLSYQVADGHKLTLGRQRIILDDARFVGNVGWRQNEQTYDAVRYSAKRERMTGDVIYMANVNRIFGDSHPVNSDFRMQSFLGNVSYQVNDALKVTGFGYFFEFENAEALSHRVLGLRATGQYPPKEKLAFTYELSFADQQDWQNDFANMDSQYHKASFGGKISRWHVSANYEMLGEGNNGPAFLTPLATLHAFNGWADVFLNTPDSGLKDYFVQVKFKGDNLTFVLAEHHFRSDRFDREFGNELDAMLTGKFSKKFAWGAKLAVFDQSDSSSNDVAKGWAWVAYKY